MSKEQFSIEPARTTADIEAIAKLFRSYASSLGIDLGYQDFEGEVASLPGKYAPPEGELLLARDSRGSPVGCVAVRPLAPGLCEMKRLYVDPSGRGLGLGKALVEAIVAEAKRIGYLEMRLDTLPTMTAAIDLYSKAGFVDIPPYYDTPIYCTVFMALSLG